jgi:class 3 adenylate cyclase
VNRYTEAVSRVMRAHGGTVLEFNGDGMMTVFGAPALPLRKRNGQPWQLAATLQFLWSGSRRTA